jgi:hypothetical protein
MLKQLYPWVRDQVSILQGTDCTPRLVWMVVEYPVPTEVLFLDRYPVASHLPTILSQPTFSNAKRNFFYVFHIYIRCQINENTKRNIN